MATGENVLWIVEKAQTKSTYLNDKIYRPTQRWLFRTKKTATAFRNKKLENSKRNLSYSYSLPLRVVWGPNQ